MSYKMRTPEQRSSSVANNMTELIGWTPMVWLSERMNKTKAKIALKLESENPTCSVKDRFALSIIEEAERAGKLFPGRSTILEVTSGNTGISLAFACAIKGYKLVIVMPEQMTLERRSLILAYGAQLVLTPATLNIAGAKQKHGQLMKEIPNAFDAAQFETPDNAKIHFETTGPEIWKQMNGKVDILVAGVGTGGTLVGAGKFLKSQNPNIKVYGVEPSESAVLSGEKSGSHKIQGIGAGFAPQVVLDNIAVIDGMVRVKSVDAIDFARRMPLSEGIFCGLSSGANVKAALDVAAMPENAGKTIVTLIPSFGERYLSSILFEQIREKAMDMPVVALDEFSTIVSRSSEIFVDRYGSTGSTHNSNAAFHTSDKTLGSFHEE